MSRRAATAAAAVLVLGLLPAPAESQMCVALHAPSVPCNAADDSRVSGDLLALGANVALGGLTAGIRQWRSEDGSFWDGLWRGAVGGVGMYAGKRIVASETFGAGLLGRGVAAAGASMTRNASEGKPLFDTLILPVGFVRLHWRPAQRELRSSFDVPNMVAIAGIYASGLGPSLDLRRSIDTGAPVFMARDWDRSTGWHGRHAFGAVLLRGDSPLNRTAEHQELVTRSMHHERVHVLQYDQAFILWNEPIEKAVHDRLGSPAWLRSMDLSLYAVGVSGLKSMLPRTWQVWEHEADFFGRTHGDHSSSMF